MKFRTLFPGLVTILTALTWAWGQGIPAVVPANGAALVNSAHSPDEAWSNVQTLLTTRLNSTNLPAVLQATGGLSQTEQYIQSSLAAKEFYIAYPSDARVAQAKKLEVMAALQGVQVGADNYKTTAFALGAAYRAGKQNVDTDRFDVAMAMESIALAPTLQNKRLIDDGVTYEKMADDLYAEFGDIKEVYSVYVSIMRTADLATSARVASKLLANKKAPDWAKAEAQTALNRSNLIGKPAGLKLTALDGRTLDLTTPVSQPTVIYFWRGIGGEAELAALNAFKATIPAGARWIYVALGGESTPTAAMQAQAPFAGTHCYEREQFSSPAALALKVGQTPCAYVLNPAGAVTGFGPPETIAALLRSAGR